jgi:hypothetical protein
MHRTRAVIEQNVSSLGSAAAAPAAVLIVSSVALSVRHAFLPNARVFSRIRLTCISGGIGGVRLRRDSLKKKPPKEVISSRLRKNVFKGVRCATLIQSGALPRTKDSSERDLRFESCPSQTLSRVFQQPARRVLAREQKPRVTPQSRQFQSFQNADSCRLDPQLWNPAAVPVAAAGTVGQFPDMIQAEPSPASPGLILRVERPDLGHPDLRNASTVTHDCRCLTAIDLRVQRPSFTERKWLMRQLVTISTAIAIVTLAACTPATARSSRSCWRSWPCGSGWSGRSPGRTRSARTRWSPGPRRRARGGWPSRTAWTGRTAGSAGGRPVPRAQLDPLANADRPDRRAPLARPALQDRQARRVTPARHRQFASSLARIAFAAEMTKSWLVLFARAVRPTERSARCLARQQPVSVYVGELGQAAVG